MLPKQLPVCSQAREQLLDRDGAPIAAAGPRHQRHRSQGVDLGVDRGLDLTMDAGGLRGVGARSTDCLCRIFRTCRTATDGATPTG